MSDEDSKPIPDRTVEIATQVVVAALVAVVVALILAVGWVAVRWLIG